MSLASRFSHAAPAIRSHQPLTNEQLAAVVPSIFAAEAHDSRSERYTYIPTIQVLNSLRREGFEPFFACQTKVRDDAKRDHTKHMLRLRHVSQIVGREANEIILLNSHDGTSSYQMMTGVFRFVCQNGMVCGDTFSEVRVHHKGDIVSNVIEGAYEVLHNFDLAKEQSDGMKSIVLSDREQDIFAEASLALKFDEPEKAPITGFQLLKPRRREDVNDDLWTTFNRVQENMIKGGVRGRTKDGKRNTSRAVSGIDGNIKLNRALWTLADKIRELKS